MGYLFKYNLPVNTRAFLARGWLFASQLVLPNALRIVLVEWLLPALFNDLRYEAMATYFASCFSNALSMMSTKVPIAITPAAKYRPAE